MMADTRNGSIMRNGMRNETILGRSIVFCLLCLGAVTMLFPIFWLISSALKSNAVIYTYPPQWIPKEFHFENFARSLERMDFLRVFTNTAIITVLNIIGQIISSVMVGYALARIRFPGRKIWFYLIIGSMMLPALVTLIPIYKLFSAIGLYNTWFPLIIPGFLGSPFYIFLTRQFICTIPYSFDEAAKIDGARHVRILCQVLVPLIKPVIAVITIMQFQGIWNDFLRPLIYLVEPQKWTLSLAIAMFNSPNNQTEWNVLMAADIIYIIPPFLVFIFCQKYFMQGLGSLNNAGLK